MLSRPLAARDAPWKRRFRAAGAWGRTAPGAPDRGLAIGKWSGSYQLHAWDVPTGRLRPLTDRPHGTFFGLLSPDGRLVYYLDDPQGSGPGHFVRVPFEGGAPEDLTLLALGRYPELWAGGMAGLAVADLTGVYRHGSDAIRGWLRSVMGGTPDEQPGRYAAGSPISYAERVRAPVLIIQGRHDTTTPPQPVEEYAGRLRALGRDVELHWFASGHLGPFADPERSIEHQGRMLRFAERVLGGR